jgi:hypothetical protein
MSRNSPDNPVNLWWNNTADQARDLFLEELARKANAWDINNIPKTQAALMQALKNTSTLDAVDDAVSVWRRILGLITIKDTIKKDKIIVLYESEEIGYFSNDPVWQEQLVRFLLALYEFAGAGNRASVIADVEEQLNSMQISVNLQLLKQTIANHRFGSEDPTTIKANTKKIWSDTRQTNRENKAQNRQNQSLEDLNIANIKSAALALRETELRGVHALINEYIRNYQLLQEEFVKAPLEKATLVQKMALEKQEFLLALGYLVDSMEYWKTDTRPLQKVLKELNIPWNMVKKARRADLKDIKEWYKVAISQWNPVWLDRNSAPRTSVDAVDRSSPSAGRNNGYTSSRSTNTGRDVGANGSAIIPWSTSIDNQYSSWSGNGINAQDVTVMIDNGVTTYIDSNGNRVTKVNYVKLSTDNLLQNYLTILPGVLDNPQSQLWALQEAKQLSLALTNRMVENPAEAARIRDGLWGDDKMIDMLKRALGRSSAEQQKLHAAYQRQLTQIKVQSMQLRGPDYASHNFLLGEAEKERALTDAFLSVFIDKYHESMKPFLHGSNPVTNLVADKSVYTKDKLISLFLPMWRSDFYTFVQNTFAPDVQLDDPNLSMNWTNGVATQWWVIDQAVQKWMESLLASGSPGLASALWATGNLLKAWYKFVKTWSIVYAGWKLLKWSFGFVSKLVTWKSFKDAWKAFTDEWSPALKATALHLWMWYLDKDRNGLSGYVNWIINETADNYLGDWAKTVPKSSVEQHEWGRELLQRVLWSRTLGQLKDQGILYSEAWQLKLNLDKLPEEEKKALIPTWFSWTQKTNLTRNLSTTLSSELGMDATLWDKLVTDQPNVQLDSLIALFYDRQNDVTRLQSVIGNDLLSKEAYQDLRYLPVNKYLEKYKQFAFIAQQKQKLSFDALYIDFSKQHDSIMAWVNTTTLITRLSLKDQHNKTAEQYLNEQLQQYAAGGDPKYLNAYFSCLAIAFGDWETCVSQVVDPNSTTSPPATQDVARWDYKWSKALPSNSPLIWLRGTKTLEQFFHDPSIGNSVNGTPLVQSPVLWHATSSAWGIVMKTLINKLDAVRYWGVGDAYTRYLTTKTWSAMCE